MEKSPAFGCRRWGFESTHFLERMIAVKDGFVRVAAATPQVSVANVEENARRVAEMVRQAAEAGCRRKDPV